MKEKPNLCVRCESAISSYHTKINGRKKFVEKYPSEENPYLCQWCVEDIKIYGLKHRHKVQLQKLLEQ